MKKELKHVEAERDEERQKNTELEAMVKKLEEEVKKVTTQFANYGFCRSRASPIG